MTSRSLFADRRIWGIVAAAVLAWPTASLAQPKAKPAVVKAAKGAPKGKAPKGKVPKDKVPKGDDMAAATPADPLDLNVARKDLVG